MIPEGVVIVTADVGCIAQWNVCIFYNMKYLFCHLLTMVSAVDAVSLRADPLFSVDMDAVSAGEKESAELSHHVRGSFRHFNLHIQLFGRRFRGLPLFLENGAVGLDNNGLLRRTTPPVGVLNPIDFHPLPSKESVSAMAIEKGFKNVHASSPGWILSDGSVYPVVRVDVHDGFPDQYQTLFIDARDGLIRQTARLMFTEDPKILGSVFPENPVTTPDVSDEVLSHLEPGAEHLYGAYSRVETCVNRDTCDTTEPVATPDSANNFRYAPTFPEDNSSADPFAEVNAYRNVSAVNAWMRENFGWQALFGDETWIDVKVGQSWDNAGYYTGNSEKPPYILFGVAEQSYAYDADTAYHEFGHAVNNSFWRHSWMTHDSYGLNTSMYTLEEALADIWAFSFSKDPVANAYIVGSRNADNRATCPSNLLGEGHYDARILSGFSWDVGKTIGIDSFSQIVYRSMSFLSNEETFSGFVETLMQSARELAEISDSRVAQWHVDVIQEVARDRGLLDEACATRLVPLKANRRQYAIGYGRKRTGNVNSPFGIQWVVSNAESGSVARLYLKWIYPLMDLDDNPVTPGYSVYLRKGSPVSVTWLDDPQEGEDGVMVVADRQFYGAPTLVEYPEMGAGTLDSREDIYVLLLASTDEPFIALEAELRFVPESSVPLPTDQTAHEAVDVSPVATGCSVGTMTRSFPALKRSFAAFLPFLFPS